MSNTADVTGGKPIAVWSQSISGVNVIIPLVDLYDIHVKKWAVQFFYFVPDTTRGEMSVINDISFMKCFVLILFFNPSSSAY
jgi:hypothetical protein